MMFVCILLKDIGLFAGYQEIWIFLGFSYALSIVQMYSIPFEISKGNMNSQIVYSDICHYSYAHSWRSQMSIDLKNANLPLEGLENDKSVWKRNMNWKMSLRLSRF